MVPGAVPFISTLRPPDGALYCPVPKRSTLLAVTDQPPMVCPDEYVVQLPTAAVAVKNRGSFARFAPLVIRSFPARPPMVSADDVPLVKSALAVPCVPLAVTVTLAANPDVLPNVKSVGLNVAVAVMRSPTVTETFRRNSTKLALPEPSVVTLMNPRYVRPSPLVASC